MRHIWSVLCRLSLEDKRSNNYSLIEAFHEIKFTGDLSDERPILIPIPFNITSAWWQSDENTNSQYNVRYVLVTPDKNSDVLQAEMKVDFENYKRYKTNMSINGIPYTVNGVYEFEIQYQDTNGEWILATSIPLEIIREDPAEE